MGIVPGVLLRSRGVITSGECRGSYQRAGSFPPEGFHCKIYLVYVSCFIRVMSLECTTKLIEIGDGNRDEGFLVECDDFVEVMKPPFEITSFFSTHPNEASLINM